MVRMKLLLELQNIVGGKSVFASDMDKAYASLDQSNQKSMPLLVVKVRSTEELIVCARLCFKERTPVVVRASGTGKVGSALGDEKTVVIDTSSLNRIISIDTGDLVAVVEPGVNLLALKEEVKKVGLFYPPDPASFAQCSIGGNVAQNAAGPSTIKYGTTKDYVLGGQLLLSTGELIDFGKRCVKGVTGYDIASLLCGSEGTLGIITKLVLRLLPLPKSFCAAEVFFTSESQALKAVNTILNRGHRPTTLEYIDHHCLKALNKLLGISTSHEACLIIECDAGYEDGAEKELLSILADINGEAVFVKDLPGLWHKRSKLSEACSKYLGHKISEDVAVPLGKLFDFASSVKALEIPHVTLGLFGHAGDGNLHVQLMYDDERYLEDAKRLRHEILLLVLEHQGTLTAEHGIGLKKKAYLSLEQSSELIELQKRIKKSFDPHNLINPGKIFDV